MSLNLALLTAETSSDPEADILGEARPHKLPRIAASERRKHLDERARAVKRTADAGEILALEAAGGRRTRRRTQRSS